MNTAQLWGEHNASILDPRAFLNSEASDRQVSPCPALTQLGVGPLHPPGTEAKPAWVAQPEFCLKEKNLRGKKTLTGTICPPPKLKRSCMWTPWSFLSLLSQEWISFGRKTRGAVREREQRGRPDTSGQLCSVNSEDCRESLSPLDKGNGPWSETDDLQNSHRRTGYCASRSLGLRKKRKEQII